MLSFISINIDLKKSALTKILKKSVNSSFNMISVDGDMSTNDTVMLIATGENKDIDFIFGPVKKHWGLLHGYKPWKIHFTWGFYSSHSTGFFIKLNSFSK